MPEIAYVNGEFMDINEAKVSVEDRGFQFADGVYEVVRTYNGSIFRLDEHLKRLKCSMEAIRLPSVDIEGVLRPAILEAIRRSGFPEALIYVQITRGASPRKHAFPEKIDPTVVITVREMVELDKRLRETGVPVITVDDIRWKMCNVKTIALLPNILANQRAREAGAFEALFVGSDGFVNEGSCHNFFIVKCGRVITPPKDHHILPGITRDAVIELARDGGYEVAEERVSLQALLGADEVFLTGTGTDVLGVIEVDGHRIGDGKPGDITTDLFSRYDRLARCKS
ncbi:MAG: D-amino acid aminotransferase [bacterium]